MSGRSYVAMGPHGPVRRLFASANSAARRANLIHYRVVVCDHADLPPLDGDEYQHAEARMVHWTQQVQRLRPDREPPSVEWRELNTADADELERVHCAWRDICRVDRALITPVLRELLEERLDEVLTRIMLRLRGAP